MDNKKILVGLAFVFSCLLMLFTGNLSADIVSTNFGLYGAQVHSLSIYNDGTTCIVYATVMGPNKVFKSTDDGATWSVILSSSDPYQGEAQDSVVDQNNGYLYVCLNDGVLKSTDAGASWSLAFNPESYDDNTPVSLAIVGSTLYLGTSGGALYKSSDNGTSWGMIGGDSFGDTSRVISTSVHPSAADIIFAVCEIEGESDLHRTGDGGDTWEEVVIPDFTDFQVVGIDPSSGDTLATTTLYIAGGSANPAVYGSGNGGNSWEKKENFSGGCPQYIVFDDDGNLFISASKSTDGGETWEGFPLSGGSTETHLNDGALAIDSNFLLASSDRGIAKSTNGGVNWVECYEGLEALVIYDAALSSDKNTFFFVSKSGAGKTSDFSGSPTWTFPIYPQNLIAGQPAAETGGQEPLMSVAIEPNYDGVEYNTVYIGGNAGEIFTSDDGGESWIMKEIYPAGSHVNVTKIAVSSDLPDVVYASLLDWERGENDGRVVKSTDKGVTWNSVLTGVPVNTVLFSQGTEEEIIVLAGLGTEEAAAEENSTMLGLRKSINGGDTWTVLNNSAIVNCLAADPTDNNIIYCGIRTYADGLPSGDFVYKSADKGDTWDKVFEIPGGTGGLCRDIIVNPDNSAEVYAAVDNYIYQSTDSGATWSLFYEGLDQDNINALIYGSLLGGSETGLYSYSSTTEEEAAEEETTTGGGGGCFIATAAFGTPMAEEVKSLCEFRDNILLKTTAGKEFAKLYYKTSPPIADFIRNKPILKAIVRIGLKPLVWLIE